MHFQTQAWKPNTESRLLFCCRCFKPLYKKSQEQRGGKTQVLNPTFIQSAVLLSIVCPVKEFAKDLLEEKKKKTTNKENSLPLDQVHHHTFQLTTPYDLLSASTPPRLFRWNCAHSQIGQSLLHRCQMQDEYLNNRRKSSFQMLLTASKTWLHCRKQNK